MASKRIEHIDVWRFFAVMLVIINHYLRFSGVDMEWLFVNEYAEQIEHLGELGVLIFFSISGFVICSGLDKEKQTTGRVCLSAFYTRRFFRIVPPLWFYLAVLMVLGSYGVVNTTPTQIFRSAFFLCNLPFEDGCSWSAGHTWSLGYEEQFYLLYPLLFLWAWQGVKNRRIFYIMALLIVSGLLLHEHESYFWADYSSCFLFLLTGCCTALLPITWKQRLYSLPLWIWLIAVTLLIGSLWVFPTEQNDVFKIFCYPLLIQLMVFGTPIHYSWVKSLFHNPVFSYFGRISYSLYLWQELATGYYANTRWWESLIYVGLVFIFAMLSFRYFEMPCQRLGTQVSDRLKIRKTNKFNREAGVQKL